MRRLQTVEITLAVAYPVKTAVLRLLAGRRLSNSADKSDRDLRLLRRGDAKISAAHAKRGNSPAS
jgi:hypothetical protein